MASDQHIFAGDKGLAPMALGQTKAEGHWLIDMLSSLCIWRMKGIVGGEASFRVAWLEHESIERV